MDPKDLERQIAIDRAAERFKEELIPFIEKHYSAVGRVQTKFTLYVHDKYSLSVHAEGKGGNKTCYLEWRPLEKKG